MSGHVDLVVDKDITSGMVHKDCSTSVLHLWVLLAKCVWKSTPGGADEVIHRHSLARKEVVLLQSSLSFAHSLGGFTRSCSSPLLPILA
jgi:hypothetical protein